ncbi:hypothetical protein FRC18_005119 [Serendipita sp. 400]|nr:hypothetical protein FRC18_005119 [Serendipita sp. 400]
MRRSGSGTKSGSSRGSMRSRRHAGADDIVLSNVWCPRKETVSTLLKLLHDHQLVQVRGTPASGKTTLMHLLHARIVNEDHNAKVYIYKHWPQNTMESIEGEERVRHYLPGYPQFQGLKTYFLFDEGQTSYWDDDLWLAFKDYIQSKQSKLVFVILFCSYGDRRVERRREERSDERRRSSELVFPADEECRGKSKRADRLDLTQLSFLRTHQTKVSTFYTTRSALLTNTITLSRLSARTAPSADL